MPPAPLVPRVSLMARSPLIGLTAQPAGVPDGSLTEPSKWPVREYLRPCEVPVLTTQILPCLSVHIPCGPLKPVNVPLSCIAGIVKMYTSCDESSEMKSKRCALLTSGETHDL